MVGTLGGATGLTLGGVTGFTLGDGAGLSFGSDLKGRGGETARPRMAATLEKALRMGGPKDRGVCKGES